MNNQDQSNFAQYAYYYDLLYKDKDYDGEVAYVIRLLRQYAPSAGNLLELGSGTGRHAMLLAQQGYRVRGVELSHEMLSCAQALEKKIGESVDLKFCQGDVRHLRLYETFDVVFSLFHVFSYMTANSDLDNVFTTARAHLDAGGVLIFDCWYGPAVLKERPAVRVKRMEDNHLTVLRIAEPVLHTEANVVDVNYQVVIRDKSSMAITETCETHRMRYLFVPEIEFWAKQSGFQLRNSETWLTGQPLSDSTWSACFILQAV